MKAVLTLSMALLLALSVPRPRTKVTKATRGTKAFGGLLVLS
jgi:hypothetical protein